jgi:hypothetical protein
VTIEFQNISGNHADEFLTDIVKYCSFRNSTLAPRRLLLHCSGRCGNDRGSLLRSGAVAVTRAVNYRGKAHKLREEAALAPSQLLRDQLTSLAFQYDKLAADLESALAP